MLQCALMIFSGCAIGDFFDVNSTMSPPHSSEEEIAIKNAVNDYLGEEVSFSKLLVGERYSSVLKYHLNEKEYIIAFCRIRGEELNSHIILLENNSERKLIKNDIAKSNVEFGSARIVHGNSGEFGELIVEGIDLDTNLPIVFSWEIKDNGIAEIDI